MRIEGPKSTSEIKKNDKTRKAGGASSSFSTFMEPETEGASAAAGTGFIGGIGNLLAVQGAEDPTERKARKRMVERADKVLDALDDVHRGLLSGRLTTDTLAGVAREVAARREKIDDPALVGLLDQVDLRAQVEMAKLEMARDAAMAKKT